MDLRLVVTGDSVSVDMDRAINMGLLTGELVVNAIKHAFKGRDRGTVTVDVRATPDEVRLSIADDGVGLPPGLDLTTSGALGMEIVRSLVEQMDGSMTVNASRGTRFDIRVPRRGR